MHRLVEVLADIIRAKVEHATLGLEGHQRESRFIFHGPPLELLEKVFLNLSRDGSIKLSPGPDGVAAVLPVLLQLPVHDLSGPNPDIGASGHCDESHLLHIRNDPNSASFVALMPPGQHNNRSVASTTEEFGMNASSNTGHATFDEWWGDGFIQELVDRGLKEAGFADEMVGEARLVVGKAAAAIDEAGMDHESRTGTWRLLSRIYSIASNRGRLSAGSALALACGAPPMTDGGIAARAQLRILERVAEEMADGFTTGINRVSANANAATKEALAAFLSHVQAHCEIPTAFERGTQAFYLPSRTFELEEAPFWWTVLTTESWAELLSEETDEASGDLTISCTNAILPTARGMPAIVRDEVELLIATGPSGDEPLMVLLSGGSFGKTPTQLNIAGTGVYTDSPLGNGQRSPLVYKIAADGRKPSTAKIISLASWYPSILVTCRMATKLSPPKKPRKGTARSEWETSLSLPGPGRYEMLILAAPGVRVIKAEAMQDDATDQIGDSRELLLLHEAKDGEFQVEIDADGKYQLEVTFQPTNRPGLETCRAYITCEEAREEGCRSEFERLIRLNRRHLEKFDSKAVVQLDRHARCSTLQSWILDEQYVVKSYLPMVLADDYGTSWASPNWDAEFGPILSQGRFLHDPRPAASQFHPPIGFLEARLEIARRIRETSDNAGLVESAPLGKWLACDPEFRGLVERYLDCYMVWLAADREVASWVDAIAVCLRGQDGRTLSRIPDAIILTPLHPLRLSWHCLAQQVLYQTVEGDNPCPCPAASILDPDCIPDLLTMPLQTPGGPSGIDLVDFLSVECDSDYWSVLWNGARLGELASASRQAPFDDAFGLTIGGISSGFSPAQVARALEDITDLLAAKPIVSLVVSSAGGATDACNEGLSIWSTKRFGIRETTMARQDVGPRLLEVFDTRPMASRPDQAMIANLSEDTGNRVRWFEKQPQGTKPDLGIIAQLDSAQPEATSVEMRSPLGAGGLIRHRIRRQLHGAFLSESRQARHLAPSGDMFADKVANCIVALEGGGNEKVGLQFAPNVHAVASMLEEKKAGFVAVSSSAIDPACFLGGWIEGTYLWDYDLPAYSHRAGDTSGYYLLSQVRDADREALGRVLKPLPGIGMLDDPQVEQILVEVARRGIPTVRGLSGDDTGATGDLGLFLAVRLLQDQFRLSGNVDSLLPVLSGSPDDATIAIIIPVDPFRGYLSDLARSLSRDRKEVSLSRPDLLVVGIRVTESNVRMHLTPIEVKCRQISSIFSPADARDALGQARSLSTLLQLISKQALQSVAWNLAYQHLLLSMIGFGLRVYSQHHLVKQQASRWAVYHERIAAAILGPGPSITVDRCGRLVVVDGTPDSASRDNDGDGFEETIVVSPTDSGNIVAGDAHTFYSSVRGKVGDWGLIPGPPDASEGMTNPPRGDQPPPPVDSYRRSDESPRAEEQAHPAEYETTNSHVEESAGPDTPPDAPPYAEAACSGIILSVGKTVDGFVPRQLSLNVSDTRLNQLNIGVVGDLGTGKTQLLKSLILQVAKAHEENRGVKPRFLIFDYKRDYSSAEFVEATGARVVRPMRLPLNLFDTASLVESAAPWLDRFRFFADVLDKVYSGIGPVQRDKLKGAVRNAYESCSAQCRSPTIYDIHAEYKGLLGGKSDTPMAIIDDLVDMEIFERDPNKTTSFDKFLDGIVVVSLDALGQDDRSKNMLVAIMLNMFYENMLRTTKHPFLGKDPQLRVIDSYLLVDEADNIMRYEFDVLRKLLLQGREFGTGVILASQYLRHFKANATDYREPLLTWFIHKVPNVTPAELGALGFTSDLGELSERVKTLPIHHCLYKSFDISGEVMRGLPFYELNQLRTGGTSK